MDQKIVSAVHVSSTKKKKQYEREFTQVINSFIQGIYG